jgi:hypothetical protein
MGFGANHVMSAFGRKQPFVNVRKRPEADIHNAENLSDLTGRKRATNYWLSSVNIRNNS